MDKQRELLGHTLRVAREKAGLTQADISTKLGYSTPQYISNWERGLSDPPLKSLPVLKEIYKGKLDIALIKSLMFEIQVKNIKRKIWGKSK